MVLLPMLEPGVAAVRPSFFALQFFDEMAGLEPGLAKTSPANVKASSVKRRTG